MGNDGNSAANSGYSSHSCDTCNAWWAVDLGKTYTITGVKLYNRHSWGEHLSNLVVAVSNRSPPFYSDRDEVCFVHLPMVPNSGVLKYRCAKPRKGRYVQLRRREWGYLVFNE